MYKLIAIALFIAAIAVLAYPRCEPNVIEDMRGNVYERGIQNCDK